MAHKNNPDHWRAATIRRKRARGVATPTEIQWITTYERTQCKIGRPRGRLEMRGRATRIDERQVASYLRALAARVHDARCERDVSLDELAAASGINSSTISRIERNVGRRGRQRGVNKGRGGYIETLVRIALCLGLTPGELL